VKPFGTAEVSRLADIPVRSLRAMVRARYVFPSRGLRNALRFSFHDLVLLRTARSLVAAGMSQRRIGQALRALRAQLPADLPPRGLSVTAVGNRVVVHEAGGQRDAETGQLLLAFEVRADGGRIQLVDRQRTPEAQKPDGEADCELAFTAALALEETDVDAAVEAYRHCVARHGHSGACANLGRLLHLQGRIDEALSLYQAGDQSDPDVLYNQGVALEDLGRNDEAIAAYQRVTELQVGHLDAHHNLARLWQQAGNERRALRHWNAYRRLLAGAAEP
jgi:tetratricopeptide (TPR) repeat protein